jgi:hypothetical protein
VDGVNPYLPPQAAIGDGGFGAPVAVGDTDAAPALPTWRLEGRTLFVRHGATLPDICLFTGEPTRPAQRLRSLLSWTPIWLRAMAPFMALYALVAYCALRRTSTVTFSLGAAGLRQQRLLLFVILAAVIVAGLIPDGRTSVGPAALALLFLGFIGLVATGLSVRLFRVAKIDRHYARLRLRPRVAAAFARLAAPPPV